MNQRQIENVQVEIGRKKDTSTATLSWKLSSLQRYGLFRNTERDDNISHFEILVESFDGRTQKFFKEHNKENANSFDLHFFKYGVGYNIAVVPIYENECRGRLKTINVYKEPTHPNDVVVSKNTQYPESKLNVSFEAPPHMCSGFVIAAKAVDTNHSVNTEVKHNFAILENLLPQQEYKINVASVVCGQTSKPSPEYTITTYPEEPKKVFVKQEISSKDLTVLISISPPRCLPECYIITEEYNSFKEIITNARIIKMDCLRPGKIYYVCVQSKTGNMLSRKVYARPVYIAPAAIWSNDNQSEILTTSIREEM